MNVSEASSNSKSNGRAHWSGRQWTALPVRIAPAVRRKSVELAVWLALADFAGFDDGLARPGVDRLALAVYADDAHLIATYQRWQQSGSDEDREAFESAMRTPRRTVSRALKSLTHAGWIEVEQKGGGKGRATTYHLINPGADCQGIDPLNSGADCQGIEPPNPDRSRTETLTTGAPNPDRSRTKPRQCAPPQQREQRENKEKNKQQQAAGAAAGAAASDVQSEQRGALIDALEEAELGSAGRQYLADEMLRDYPDVTPGDVAEAMSDASDNAGIGARVEHIRENIGDAIQARRERQEREQALEDHDRWIESVVEQLDADAQEAIEAVSEETRKAIADLPQADRAHLKRQATSLLADRDQQRLDGYWPWQHPGRPLRKYEERARTVLQQSVFLFPLMATIYERQQEAKRKREQDQQREHAQRQTPIDKRQRITELRQQAAELTGAK